MVVASLVNTERRMLKAMLAKPEYSWSLEEILSDCEWHDQAVAVGAGQGLADKHLVTIDESTTTEVRLSKNGHYYTGFVDSSFTYGNNIGNISEEARAYETKITLNVIGYLMGSGVNDNQPKISIRENAVEFKMSRERVIFGDIPEHIDSENKNKSIDGGYRE